MSEQWTHNRISQGTGVSKGQFIASYSTVHTKTSQNITATLDSRAKRLSVAFFDLTAQKRERHMKRVKDVEIKITQLWCMQWTSHFLVFHVQSHWTGTRNFDTAPCCHSHTVHHNTRGLGWWQNLLHGYSYKYMDSDKMNWLSPSKTIYQYAHWRHFNGTSVLKLQFHSECQGEEENYLVKFFMLSKGKAGCCKRCDCIKRFVSKLHVENDTDIAPGDQPEKSCISMKQKLKLREKAK